MAVGRRWTGGDPGTGRGSGIRGGLPPQRPDQQYRPIGPQAPIGSATGRFARLFVGQDFVINSFGAFFYEPSIGPGNLALSISKTSGTDAGWGGGGNSYLAGLTTYESLGSAGFLAQQNATGELVWWAATSEAGPWHLATQISYTTAGVPNVGLATFDLAANLLSLAQAGTPPTPVNTGYLYVDVTGHLHYLGPGGTNTILANP